jgi:hypothetical protein
MYFLSESWTTFFTAQPLLPQELIQGPERKPKSAGAMKLPQPTVAGAGVDIGAGAGVGIGAGAGVGIGANAVVVVGAAVVDGAAVAVVAFL